MKQQLSKEEGEREIPSSFLMAFTLSNNFYSSSNTTGMRSSDILQLVKVKHRRTEEKVRGDRNMGDDRSNGGEGAL